MDDIFDSVIAKAAGISATHPLAPVLVGRSAIIELSERSHAAALQPERPGGLSHWQRAGLACRIARLNHEDVLARHFESMIERGEDSGRASRIADPAFDGADDTRLAAILRHTDLVATDPKQATADDVSALVAADVLEEDIVRLSGLIAFASYQIRVTQGLRLMKEVV